MAVRLINLHRQPLRIDLRGGEALILAAGQCSSAMREELLYDNQNLSTWERAGWIARLPAQMREIVAPVPFADMNAGQPAKAKTVSKSKSSSRPPKAKVTNNSQTPKQQALARSPLAKS